MSSSSHITFLEPPARTLPRMLQAQAERHGDRPLLTFGDTTWSFRDARDIAARRGGALLKAGISRGDRVAMLCGNHLEIMEILLACGWIGAIAVPINTAAMGPQISYYLANSGARLLVIDADFVERLEHAQPLAPSLEKIWIVGSAKTTVEIPSEPLPPRSEPAEAAAVAPGDTFAILYTSGTTGPSKGVMCAHAQYYWWGVNSSELLEVTSDDVLCTTLPLFHINALNTFAQALLTGAHMAFEQRFSASGFWPAMVRHQATVIYVLGAMVPILLAQDRTEHERAHRARVGLAPGAPAELMAQFAERTGARLIEGYGSTETNFVIGDTVDAQKPGFMGRVRKGYEACVVDDQDVEVPVGEMGELVLRASEPFAFATGYFGMPDKTVEAWRNLWFHTGDRVLRDEDGYFRFADRLKDAIRRRGENISAFEVEQALMSHPDVEIAAVYPVKSELAEDEVMAAISLRGGRDVDPIVIMSHCETRLPYFAIPRFLDFVSELPRTENGKVQKYKLRERGVTSATWDREAAGYRLSRGGRRR
ncbi:ATP-dependent acyl-CoA ligase [Terrarubrum flagellatum]|uniref:ATP-dependent acyl-CoA ligase n=1 Tax=Terrirubrum flagellatum TaxID=2895980 RepID=UPI0031455B4F